MNGPASPANAEPLLRVRGLSKRFGGLVALDGLNLEVFPGEILGVIGPNGAGKSTAFNIIAGALAADAGEVRLAGEPIIGLPAHAIAAHGLMRTFQHNRPFSGMSLADNVLVGAHRRRHGSLAALLLALPAVRRRETELQARAGELIRFVGLEDCERADVATLSFGQGRLLEVARALAGEPRLILLDEPVAGLTATESGRLASLIGDISRRGIAVLLIEHDMRFLLPLAQRVAVLNFGRKIADGPPAEIRTDPEVVTAYLGGAAGDGLREAPPGEARAAD